MTFLAPADATASRFDAEISFYNAAASLQEMVDLSECMNPDGEKLDELLSTATYGVAERLLKVASPDMRAFGTKAEIIMFRMGDMIQPRDFFDAIIADLNQIWENQR